MTTTASVGAATVTVPFSLTLTAFPNNVPFNGPWTYSGARLSQGTAAGQCDLIYATQLTIAGGGTTTIDLATLTNEFGTSISFARLKALYIENNVPSGSTGASAIAVGNAGVNPFAGIWSPGTATVSIRKSTCFWTGIVQDATGYVVGTGVNILITNSDGTNAATVNILIAGCSV